MLRASWPPPPPSWAAAPWPAAAPPRPRTRTPCAWDLFSGADGALLDELIGIAAPDMPGTDVDRTVLEWGTPYYTKLAMASAGGRGPDVAVCHMSRLAGYAPLGLLDPWDTSLLAEFGVREADFADAVWQRTRYRDQAYAVPWTPTRSSSSSTPNPRARPVS
ncbi:hypothetical protein ACFQV4_26495 [Streptomyces thermocarboxydus]